MLIMSPFFDDMDALYAYKYSPGCILRILMSCIFAIGVNITNYVVIGKTSPLTYQVPEYSHHLYRLSSVINI